jgi:hypothetical protein
VAARVTVLEPEVLVEAEVAVGGTEGAARQEPQTPEAVAAAVIHQEQRQQAAKEL